MDNNKSTYWGMTPLGGKPRSYSPDALWAKAVEYFEWVLENPLQEERVSGGDVIKVNKMRAMTIRGFCLYAGIDNQTFANYEKDTRYFGITTRIRDIIYQQKFEGAAADLLNVNIIARELGLAEKSEATLKVMPDEVRKNLENMSTGDIAAIIGDERE